METLAALQPDALFAGRYRVVSAIKAGGMGAVYEVLDEATNARRALKVMLPSLIEDEDMRARFALEARITGDVESDHIARVLHAGVDDATGMPFIVMELLRGRDLGAELKARGSLPADEIATYLAQAARALDKTHAAGIVHRDLKPANMFLEQRAGGASIVKVLDFGISRLAGERAARVTRVDERIGTPEYMSPEQLQGVSDVDARADIWGLGVTLYELVTGQLPFRGEDLPQLCVAILTKAPVPMSAVHPDATPELELIVARCLEKDRAKRYQNIAELAQDLATIWEGEVPSRVQQIARVMVEAGANVAPPTPFPGSLRLAEIHQTLAAQAQAEAPPAAPASASQPKVVTIEADATDWVQEAAASVGEHVAAVLRDASGATVDELEFLSLDEAYDYVCSQSGPVVRCDIYDQLAGVRGRRRVTYAKSPESGHWVPRLMK